MATINISGTISFNLDTTDDSAPTAITTKTTRTQIVKSIVSANATVLKEYTGTFSTNNNSLFIHRFTSTTEANLLIIIVDKPVAVRLTETTTGRNRIDGLVVDGVFVVRLKDFSPRDQNTLYFIASTGFAATSTPVEQGVDIKYYVAIVDDNQMAT